MEKEIISNAWSMSGWIISYDPGILTLKDNNISFITTKGQQFSVPLNSVSEIKWPKMQMGYGVHMTVQGKKYKFTFMQPASKYSVDTGLIVEYGALMNAGDLTNRISKMGDYKAVEKEWREVLGG